MIRWSAGGALLGTGPLTGCSDERSPNETTTAGSSGGSSVVSSVSMAPAAGVVTGQYGSIALTDTTVWVRTTDTFVTRIARATGEVIDDQNTAVYADIASRLTSGGDIVTGFGSIWTSTYDDAKLFRISTGEPAP